MKTYTDSELKSSIMRAQNWLDPSEIIDEQAIAEMLAEALEDNEDQEDAVNAVMGQIEDRAVDCARDRARSAASAAQKILFGDNA